MRIENDENGGEETSVEPSKTTSARPSTSSRDLKKPAAPMPHPILKKSRGPSNTGPHPTARFVSPPGSEDEKEKKSSISPNAHVVVRPPTPELKGERESQNTLKVPPSTTSAAKKKGKGHVVATGAGRRRPAVVRRKSSQSSTERHASEKSVSNIDEKEESGDETEKESTTRDPLPTASNLRGTEGNLKKGSSSTLTQQLKSHGDKPTDVSGKDSQVLSQAGPGPSSQLTATQNALLATRSGSTLDESELDEEELKELELQKFLLAEANARVGGRQPTRSSSQVLRQNLRSVSLSNLKPAGNAAATSVVKGKASVAPRLAEAAGVLDNTPHPTEPKNIEKSSSLQFPKRTVPSLSAKDPSISKLASPLVSKSQSQLALLLQQDSARTKESSSKGKGKEKQTETGSEDTQDEGLQMPLRAKKKK